MLRAFQRTAQLAVAAALTMTVVGGCAPVGEGRSDAPDAMYSLSPEPVLQIGAIEGTPAYQFGSITDLATMSDGRLAVLDGLARELRLFSSDGRHIWTVGRKGNGPGEFRGLAYVYMLDGDSVKVYDQSLRRFSLFDSTGALVRTDELVRDTTVAFPLHIWLHGRHIVYGGEREDERRAVRATLERASLAASNAPWHATYVGPDGTLFIQSASAAQWTVIARDGRSLGPLGIPERFELLEIRPDAFVGRWRDENDVEFVRAYRLLRNADYAGGTLAERPPARTMPDPSLVEAARTEMRSFLRNMVMAQELHYARRGTYTDTADSLSMGRPEHIAIGFLWSSARGWIGVASHRDMDLICVLGVGRPIGGWSEGVPVCS